VGEARPKRGESLRSLSIFVVARRPEELPHLFRVVASTSKVSGHPHISRGSPCPRRSLPGPSTPTPRAQKAWDAVRTAVRPQMGRAHQRNTAPAAASGGGSRRPGCRRVPRGVAGPVPGPAGIVNATLSRLASCDASIWRALENATVAGPTAGPRFRSAPQPGSRPPRPTDGPTLQGRGQGHLSLPF